MHYKHTIALLVFVVFAVQAILGGKLCCLPPNDNSKGCKAMQDFFRFALTGQRDLGPDVKGTLKSPPW